MTDLRSAITFVFMCSATKSSSRNFQKFAGLPPTGVLDDATKSKMAEPRCGVPDVDSFVKDGGRSD
jgi:hypothetical protein